MGEGPGAEGGDYRGCAFVKGVKGCWVCGCGEDGGLVRFYFGTGKGTERGC